MTITKGIFPQGKKKSLIFSYDDDYRSNVKLADMFRRYGVKATFNFNGVGIAEDGTQDGAAKPIISKSEVKAISEDFEVACHGYRHPAYGYLNCAQVADDLICDRRALEEIVGKPIRGFALPSGVFSEETKAILKSCGVVYSRTINDSRNFDMPADFLEWNTTIKHDQFDELYALGEAYCKGSWRLNTYLSCFLIYGHSYELDPPEKWEKLEEFVRRMAGHDDIWYTTCIDLYDYMQALNGLIMTVDGTCVINPSLTDVWVQADGKPTLIPAGQTVRL